MAVASRRPEHFYASDDAVTCIMPILLIDVNGINAIEDTMLIDYHIS